jgi:lipopolysaccharide transport protein LptA
MPGPRRRNPDSRRALAAACLAGLLLASTGSAQEPARPNPQPDATPAAPAARPATSLNSTTHPGDALQTDIYADKEAEFDSKTRSGVFRGNVRVEDPEFTITSDVLTVYLDKEENGLREAIATGNVTIVQRKTAAKSKTGKAEKKTETPASVGKGEKLVYEGATGKATLSGWPQALQGINLIKATEPGTIMIFNRGGKMTTSGKTKTEIRQQQ